MTRLEKIEALVAATTPRPTVADRLTRAACEECTAATNSDFTWLAGIAREAKRVLDEIPCECWLTRGKPGRDHRDCDVCRLRARIEEGR